MQPINLVACLRQFSEHWSPRIIASLNDQEVKLAKFQGAFDWHAHENEDELFLVVQGEFTMEFRDRSVILREGEMIVVPRGVEHRPVAEQECHVLLFEPAGIINTGNARNSDKTNSAKWLEGLDP
jgi:mannose-6-phosphate isomerase-like protein (cupin superfamily)